MMVWPDVWPKNKCRSVWPIFHGSVILPYILKTIWCMNIILWDYESVWHNIWPQNKCRSLWPIFHGPVILSYILKTIWYMNTILGIMSRHDPMFHLKIFVAHCDIYFMVQWFCLRPWNLIQWLNLQIFVGHCDLYFMVLWICPLLFDVWTSYFRIMSQHDMTFDLEINVGHCDL